MVLYIELVIRSYLRPLVFNSSLILPELIYVHSTNKYANNATTFFIKRKSSPDPFSLN